MKGEINKNIVLGKGIFFLDETPIGLTRDGGTFKVEYEHRVINADGDRGTVKGRVVREGAKAFITINHLEVLTQIAKLHTGVKEDTTTKEGYTTITGTGKITDEDYHTVTFKGQTKDGREVIIEILNAINLENIEWTLKDKDDIVDTVTYEATYDPQAEDEYNENWSVSFKN
jgi:hypothetical protein